MSQILNEVLAANERYAATFGGKAKLIIPPARHFAVLTCMDARLDPAKFAGLAEGDAHSSATPAAAPARMPFGPWSFLTNCSEPANGLSFIILIAAWSVHERNHARTAREEPGDGATGRGQGGDPGRRGIGLVEIPFVEPEAEVCQADLPGVLVESGHRLTAPCLKARLPLTLVSPRMLERTVNVALLIGK